MIPSDDLNIDYVTVLKLKSTWTNKVSLEYLLYDLICVSDIAHSAFVKSFFV